MSDKDKLAETLHDKGKAEEDMYFAQQDREKLGHIRDQSAEDVVGDNSCPKCGTPLSEQAHQGVTIDTCRACGGIWLDKGELESIVVREGESWFSGWVRSLLDQAK